MDVMDSLRLSLSPFYSARIPIVMISPGFELDSDFSIV